MEKIDSRRGNVSPYFTLKAKKMFDPIRIDVDRCMYYDVCRHCNEFAMIDL